MPEEERLRGLELLRVAVKACRIQMKKKLYFILEHPQGASSWKVPEVQELINMDGVVRIDLDQCMFGLTSRDEQGAGLVEKSTRIVTNMPHTAVVLHLRCS